MTTNHRINKMPFYWRLSGKERDDGGGLPKELPFEFDIDCRHDLLIQKRESSVLSALNIVYQKEANIGYLQDENLLAKQYGVDFFDFLERYVLAYKGIESILEIGCGGCVMLEKLRSLGYSVTGVDSSPFALNAGQRKGVRVIQDFFPSTSIVGTFDLIFHVDVLEHVDDYLGFLRSQYEQLSDNGLLVVNVPDASRSIELGDCSMAMHQHLNYFSEHSLKSVLEATGFSVLRAQHAGYGGSIYVVASKKPTTARPSDPLPDTVRNFFNLSLKNSRTFSTAIRQILDTPGNTIGFYVPLRAIPYISMTELDFDFRFFDDTPHWHNLYFDGMDVRIENFADLVRTPVTHMLIMSLTFADVIQTKIRHQFGDSMTVLTLAQMLKDT